MYDGENLNLTLRCEEDFCVNAYIQDPEYTVNRDYDAIAFLMARESDGKGMQTCRVRMPLSELQRLKNVRNGEQAIDLLFGKPDGSRFLTRIIFNWDSLNPGDSIPVAELKFRQGY